MKRIITCVCSHRMVIETTKIKRIIGQVNVTCPICKKITRVDIHD